MRETTVEDRIAILEARKAILVRERREVEKKLERVHERMKAQEIENAAKR